MSETIQQLQKQINKLERDVEYYRLRSGFLSFCMKINSREHTKQKKEESSFNINPKKILNFNY